LKDFILVDFQTHFLQKDKDYLIENLKNYFIDNKNDLNNIYLIVDTNHETFDIGENLPLYEKMHYFIDKLSDKDISKWIYLEEFEILDFLDLMEEKYQNHIEDFLNYIIKYHIPPEISYSLIILKNKYNINIHTLDKEYGYQRAIIDNNIDILPYIHALVLELYKNGIYYFNLDYTELGDINIPNIKKIINSLQEEFYMDIYSIIEVFEEFHLDIEDLIEKYSFICKNNLGKDIDIAGGGTMECLFEETSSLLLLNKHLNTNIYLNPIEELVYGNCDYLNYDWVSELQQDNTAIFRYAFKTYCSDLDSIFDLFNKKKRERRKNFISSP